jgi:hypothetical protein
MSPLPRCCPSVVPLAAPAAIDPGLPLAAGLQALLATALCGFALALVLLPQRLLQRPLSQGVVSLHISATGQLRLWHQPIRQEELNAFLQATAERRPGSRLRVIPDPDVNWGRLRNLLLQLQRSPLPLDLQLPAPTRSAHLLSSSRA